MAYIKNPISTGGIQAVNSTLTVAITTSSPAEIKSYINSVIANMPELQSGNFFAINRSNWALGSADRLCMFNIQNGTIKTDSAIRISYTGNMSARSMTATSGLYIYTGDTFEFIKAE